MKEGLHKLEVAGTKGGFVVAEVHEDGDIMLTLREHAIDIECTKVIINKNTAEFLGLFLQHGGIGTGE